MNKSILNLGKALNKAEQSSINGGIHRKEMACRPGYVQCTVYDGGSPCCPTMD